MRTKHAMGVVAIILSFLMVNSASAQGGIFYPVDTPQTTYDPSRHYTENTLEVNPKWMQIAVGHEVEWTIEITDVILGAGHGIVDTIEVWIWVGEDWVTDLTSSTPEVPEDASYTGPAIHHDNWYLLTVTANTYFYVGNMIELTFHITTPDTLAPGIGYELVKKYHRSFGDFSGQESSSGYDIEIIFNVGPDFVIPELPLGTLLGLAIPMTALGLLVAFKRFSLPSFLKR